MKCLFCSNSIDEARVIDDEDLGARKKHAAALQEWSQFTIHLNVHGGQQTLLSTHVCKDHADKLASGSFRFTITAEGKLK